MITVMVSYPNGNRREVLLSGVPRIGESIQLQNGADEPALEVTHVSWLEGQGRQEPTVLVKVRPRTNTG